MSYAVVWSENDGPVYAGHLELADRFVLLSGTAPQALESRRKLLCEELADVSFERRPGDRLGGRPTLVVARPSGPTLRLASIQGGGALHELAERLAAACGKAAAPIMAGADVDGAPERDDSST